MYNSLRFMRINIAEFTEAIKSIDSRRIAHIMRKLARAAVLDSWDWNEGDYTLTSGDKIFTPKSAIERRFWASLRRQQKEDFRNYVKSRDGGNAGGRPAKKAPGPEPKQTESKKERAREIISNLSNQMRPAQNNYKTIPIRPGTDVKLIMGRFGDFMRQRFRTSTLNTLTNWLQKNYLNKDVKIATMIKTAASIERVDSNVVLAEYLRLLE